MRELNISDEYGFARRKAKTRYLKNISKGISGYLPSLDGIIQNLEISSEMSLGIVEIPLKKVIGAYSYSRSRTFADNFLPLGDQESEFADKWCTLYKSHLEIGIRDPIKVYEYLNWFYVIEGNKRVSVLKYLDAFNIRAEVRRLIPKEDKTDKVKSIYYEFLKFNKKSQIFSIWFSEEKKFSLLEEYLEKYEPKLLYDKDKYGHFLNRVYLPFRKIYYKLGGEKLSITTGDALLEYIKIYNIPQEINSKYHTRIKAFLEELKLIAGKETIEIQTAPVTAPKKKVITKITDFVKIKKKIKVAFAYARSIKESGWSYSHELGRLHIENTLAKEIETSYIENVPENNDAYNDIKKLAKEKNDVIITTSPNFINATLKAALEYPNIKFINCSGTNSFKKVRTFYGRIHEPRFLMGLIAGSLTKTDVIGYLATHPIAEEIAGINAFAIGAHTVNPYAKVKLGWTKIENKIKLSQESAQKLINNGSDIIFYDHLSVPDDTTRKCGLHSIDGQQLALPIWHWGVFYDRLIRNVLSGSWNELFDVTNADQKLLNFWWGIDSGIVDIFYSLTHVPRETQRLVDFMRKMIIQNEFRPFTGPIYDQEGVLRFTEEEVVVNDKIISMNWLVNFVEGEIPKTNKI